MDSRLILPNLSENLAPNPYDIFLKTELLSLLPDGKNYKCVTHVDVINGSTISIWLRKSNDQYWTILTESDYDPLKKLLLKIDDVFSPEINLPSKKSPLTSFHILYFNLIELLFEYKYELNGCNSYILTSLDLTREIESEIKKIQPNKKINRHHPLFHFLDNACIQLSNYLNKNMDSFDKIKIKLNDFNSQIDPEEYLAIKKCCIIQILRHNLLEIKSSLYDATTAVDWLKKIEMLYREAYNKLEKTQDTVNEIAKPWINYGLGESLEITQNFVFSFGYQSLRHKTQEYDKVKSHIQTQLVTPNSRNEFTNTLLQIVFNDVFWERQGMGVSIIQRKTPNGILLIRKNYLIIAGKKDYIVNELMELNDDQIIQFLISSYLTCTQKLDNPSSSQSPLTGNFYQIMTSLKQESINAFAESISPKKKIGIMLPDTQPSTCTEINSKNDAYNEFIDRENIKLNIKSLYTEIYTIYPTEKIIFKKSDENNISLAKKEYLILQNMNLFSKGIDERFFHISPCLSFQILSYKLIHKIFEYKILTQAYSPQVITFLADLTRKINHQIQQISPREKEINQRHPLFNLLNEACASLSTYLEKNRENFLNIINSSIEEMIELDQYVKISRYCSIQILLYSLLDIKSSLYDQIAAEKLVYAIGDFCADTMRDLNSATKMANDAAAKNSKIFKYASGDSLDLARYILECSNHFKYRNNKILIAIYDEAKSNMINKLFDAEIRKEFANNVFEIVFNKTFWEKQGEINFGIFTSTKIPDAILEIHKGYKMITGKNNYVDEDSKQSLNDNQISQFLIELYSICKMELKDTRDSPVDHTKTFYQCITDFDIENINTFAEAMNDPDAQMLTSTSMHITK